MPDERGVSFAGALPAAAQGVALIMPVLAPAPGGAAQYAALLARELVGHGVAQQAVVFSERYPGTPASETLAAGRVAHRRIFPFRAGRARKDVWSYLGYALQNLQFLSLPVRLRRQPVDAVIVHASFHLHPSTIGPALGLARSLSRGRLKLIADVRDPKLEGGKLARLHAYDAVICCGERVMRELAHDPVLRGKLRLVPIPFHARRPSAALVTACLERHGLTPEGFFFFPNGLSHEKGIELAIETVSHLHQRGRTEPLIVAGKGRDSSPAIARALESGLARYLGPLANEEILALDAAAGLVINVSTVEVLPRSVLEAFAVGARALLPPGIPEFARHCPRHVAPALEAAALADKILEILALPPPVYPLDEHHPDRVMRRYRDLLSNPEPARAAADDAPAPQAARRAG
jgi:glycosyltransferase involved in cell wall biosynthesis